MPGPLKRDVGYRCGGLTMNGYFSSPTDGAAKRPAVLIVHDAFGLDWHCIGVADRLAAAGYAAFSLDLWGARRQFTNPDGLMQIVRALVNDRATWMGRVEAARQTLVAQPGVDSTRIAAIGYCLGGSTVLEFARGGGEISGVVSFHGGLDLVGTDWSSAPIKAKLLLCFRGLIDGQD